MKEQDAAHSFGKKHPDFPEWIKTKDGLDCMMWPITDEKYLYNKLEAKSGSYGPKWIEEWGALIKKAKLNN